MNEEHTSIAPSTEQAENERDARAEELQSTFRMMDIKLCERSCLHIFVILQS